MKDRATVMKALLALACVLGCSPDTIFAVTKGGGSITTKSDASDDARGADVAVAPPDDTGYHTSGPNILDGSGAPFQIRAITWLGTESDSQSPHGLCCRTLDSITAQIESLRFNTIRLPWTWDFLDKGKVANVEMDLQYKDISGLSMLDAMVAEAAMHHLKVIFVHHTGAGQYPVALWTDATHDEQNFIDHWTLLASHFAGNQTVIGFDLQSDVGGKATWAEGGLDWRAAAERTGNAILQVNRGALIIVGGVELVGTTTYWRGGNLQGVAKNPVRLSPSNHLVYGAQDFPSSVNNQPPGATPPSWFSEPTFPMNLSKVWDTNWGYIAQAGMTPVMVAGFGTGYATTSDRQWLDTLVGYVGQRKLSFSYWALNPESPDSQGLITGDMWTGENTALVNALRPILP